MLGNVSLERIETLSGSQQSHASDLTGMFGCSFISRVRLVKRATSTVSMTMEANATRCSLEHISMELGGRLSILFIIGGLTLQAWNVRVDHLLLVDFLGVARLVLRF